MAKENIGLKLDPEVAAKFRALQGQHDSVQSLIESLISSHAQMQTDADTSSPVFKEKGKVAQALAQVDRVVGSYLEIAAQDKVQAEEKSRSFVAVAEKQMVELQEKAAEQKTLLADLEAEKIDHEKLIAELRGQAESTSTLKEAWSEKESTLNNRITELDAEAQEARALQDQVSELEKAQAGLEKEIVEKDGQLALGDQQHTNDQSTLSTLRTQLTDIKEAHQTVVSELKADLKQTREDLNQVRVDLDDANNALNTEKLGCADRILGIEKDKGKLVGEIAAIEKRLVNQDELQKRIVFLESEYKSAVDKNNGQAEQIKDLQKIITETKTAGTKKKK